MIDKLALARQIAEARKLMISRGGQATLRFGVCQEYGLVATNHRKVAETMAALWNAAPELLGIGLDPVIQAPMHVTDPKHVPAELGDDCS